MSQITIYLPKKVQEKMREAASAAGVSQSKWVTKLIEEELRETWPEEVLSLVGAWPDMPDLEDIRAGYGEDVPRETQ